MPRKMTNKLNGKFTIAKMRDVVAECADNLTVAIAEQNPNVDGFALETDLRSLVQKHGSGETPPAATDVTASDARPEYSLAGDLLVLAFQAAQNGDWRSAFRTFASAVEAEDAADLIGGIEGMNAQTKVAEDAESLDAEDDLADDEQVSEDDVEDAVGTIASEMDGDDLESEDEEDAGDLADESADEADADVAEEDDAEYTAEDSEEDAEEVTAEDGEEEFDDDSEDASEEELDDEDQDGVPMGGASSRPVPAVASVQGKLKAIANKLSLAGDAKGLREANKVLKQGKK